MAFRVGIDVASVDSIRDSITTHGSKYLARLYTPQEIEDRRTAAGVDPRA